jgi:hypothetical protein
MTLSELTTKEVAALRELHVLEMSAAAHMASETHHEVSIRVELDRIGNALLFATTYDEELLHRRQEKKKAASREIAADDQGLAAVVVPEP